MGRGLFAVSLLLSLGCSDGADDAGASRDTMSQRSRDSLIGASGLPGAAGISGAIKVADSAAERRRREDSVSSSP